MVVHLPSSDEVAQCATSSAVTKFVTTVGILLTQL